MAASASQHYHAGSLDILKGGSLLALLLMNCNRWFAAVTLPDSVYTIHNGLADTVINQFISYFLTGHWYAALAFLLGIQFFNSSKKESSQQRADYFRRYLILLLIGLAHQVIWNGDILVIYALSGMLLVLLQRKGANLSLLLGLLFISNLPGFFASLFVQLIQGKPPEYSATVALNNASYYGQLMEKGSIMQFIQFNIGNILPKYKHTLLTGTLFRVMGFYVLGYYAGRINFLQQFKDNVRFFGLILLGLSFVFLSLLYLQISMFSSVSNLVLDPVKGMVANMQNVFGASASLLTGLLALEFYRVRQLLSRLAGAGHQWLSMYLFQTLTGILVFYPIGLHLYPATGPAVNSLIAIGIFILQLIFGNIWQRYFYYGPVEWLWRSAAAYRWRRMRRSKR